MCTKITSKEQLLTVYNNVKELIEQRTVLQEKPEKSRSKFLQVLTTSRLFRFMVRQMPAKTEVPMVTFWLLLV